MKNNIIKMSTEDNLEFNVEPRDKKDIPIIKFTIPINCEIIGPSLVLKDSNDNDIKSYGKIVKSTHTRNRSWKIFEYHPPEFTEIFEPKAQKEDIIELYIKEKERFDPNRSKFEIFLKTE